MAFKGPAFKYAHLIFALEDEDVYCPASIVRHAEQDGLLDLNMDPADLKNLRRKIRHTLARMSANHKFPFHGDGWVEISGQAPLRGWYGWRWKEVLEKRNGRQFR